METSSPTVPRAHFKINLLGILDNDDDDNDDDDKYTKETLQPSKRDFV